jgi:GH25 family lysozyme M1 (1,4-beta-N-acetylmuramidase)
MWHLVREKTMVVQCLDLSSAQGTISASDWAKLAAQGIGAAFIQCGIGNDGKSGSYETFVAGAKSVGILTIPYHFLYIGLPTNPAHPNRDPVSQAKLHANYCNNLPACIDVEYMTTGDFAKFGLPAGDAGAKICCQWLEQYLDTYESETGVVPWVYTYPNYAQSMNFPVNFSSIAKYPLWVASYEPTPTIPAPWSNFVAWQYSGGSGHLPSGAPVDQDSVDSLDVFASLGVSVGSPVAIPVDVAPVVATVVEPTSIPDVSPTQKSVDPNLCRTITTTFRGFFR